MSEPRNECKNASKKCSVPVVGEYVKLNNEAFCIENLLSENYYVKIRACVRSSIAKITGYEDVYLGYIYKGNGRRYQTYYLCGGLENVARFICSSDENKMLCNELDHPLLCSVGTRLDLIKCEDGVKEKLQYYINQYRGERERPSFFEL